MKLIRTTETIFLIRNINRIKDNKANSSLMKTIFAFFSAFLSLGLPAQNLIVNGGGETGDLTGWTTNSNSVSTATVVNQTNGTILPYDGEYFFSFSNQPGDSATLSQTGQVILPGDTLQLTGFFHGEAISDTVDNDFGEVILYTLNSDTLVLDSVSTGQLLPESPETWIDFTLSLPTSENSAFWKIDLKGKRRFGNFINVFYDSLSINTTISTYLPENGLNHQIKLYPNPVVNQLKLSYDNSISLKKIVIYTMDGVKAKELFVADEPAIDVSDLGNGKYLVSGYDGNDQLLFRERIVILNRR